MEDTDDPYAQFVSKPGTAPAAAPVGDDPYAQFVPKQQQQTGNDPWYKAMFTDIPEQIGQHYDAGLQALNENLNPFSEAYQKRMLEQSKQPWYQRMIPDAGPLKVAAGAADFAFAPITGTAESVIGHPLNALENTVSRKPIPFEQTAQGVDLALSGIRPGRGAPGPGIPAGPPAPTPVPKTVLSEGQATQDLPKIQFENMARNNQLGPEAQHHASAFDTQQQNQVADEQARVQDTMAPGQPPVDARQAGDIAQQSIISRQQEYKKYVNDYYDWATQQPGEMHPDVFNGLGDYINRNLFNRANDPVIIDQNTPNAQRAVNYLNSLHDEENPNPLNLQAVNQARKLLVRLRSNAYGSANGQEDGRAMSEVINAFDDHIDYSAKNGGFSGPASSVKALSQARDNYNIYRNTYTSPGMDQITGRKPGTNPLDPADVVNKLVGATGVRPNSANINLVKQAKGILGDTSPEWGSVRQGLFQRLLSDGYGRPLSDVGVERNLRAFLNTTMADEVYTPKQKDLIRSFADLRKQLITPPGGKNTSYTAAFSQPIHRKILQTLTGTIGAILADSILPGAGRVGHLIEEVAGFKAGAYLPKMFEEGANARQIAKQMPLIGTLTKQYTKALARYNKSRTPPNVTGLLLATNQIAAALGLTGDNNAHP